MNEIERDIMTGMISILNQVIESNHNGTPIMGSEQFDVRLADLNELENETGVMFINSPNCKIDIQSIVTIKEINETNLKKCKDISEVIEYSNQKDMIVYPEINGLDMIATYTDGYLTNIQINDSIILEKIKSLNLPYKIKKDDTYIIKGKMVFGDKAFYVSEVIEGGNNDLRDDLHNAKKLNFDIISFWFANNLNSKKLQDAIDYVYDYVEDDGLICDGVIFKFNENKFKNVLNFNGCYWSK